MEHSIAANRQFRPTWGNKVERANIYKPKRMRCLKPAGRSRIISAGEIEAYALVGQRSLAGIVGIDAHGPIH